MSETGREIHPSLVALSETIMIQPYYSRDLVISAWGTYLSGLKHDQPKISSPKFACLVSSLFGSREAMSGRRSSLEALNQKVRKGSVQISRMFSELQSQIINSLVSAIQNNINYVTP